MGKDNLFDFDEDMNVGFDNQLKSINKTDREKLIKKALVLCLRKKFDEALDIYESIIEEDVEYIPAYIGILRVHSENFKKFNGDEIEADLNIIDELGDGSEADDENYINYLNAREEYFNSSNNKKENSPPNGILTKEETKKKYDEEKYDEIVESVKYYADLGDREFICYLGEMFEFGYGVSQNCSKALELYEKAVKLGENYAYICFGWHYYLESDLIKALNFFEKAVDHGVPDWWGIALSCEQICDDFEYDFKEAEETYEHNFEYYYNKMYEGYKKSADLGIEAAKEIINKRFSK